MNYSGIIVGLISLAIIGLWHFIVIKGEYLLGKRICILIFAIIGFIFICVSMLTDNTEISVLLALFGFFSTLGNPRGCRTGAQSGKGMVPQKKQEILIYNK